MIDVCPDWTDYNGYLTDWVLVDIYSVDEPDAAFDAVPYWEAES